MQTTKATFVLPTRLLDDVRELVNSGLADSVSAVVRQSLEATVRQLREERIRVQFEEAARDPMFLADLQESLGDFEGISGDGLDD